MRKSKAGKANNRGSTLLIVLITVAFIAILGTIAISMAMLNYKMKLVSRDAKKTFYTAEEAVDEIYAGLGKLSMESLDQAYTEQLSSITRQNIIGGESISYSVSNRTANLNVRKNFTQNVVNRLFDENRQFDEISLRQTSNIYFQLTEQDRQKGISNTYEQKLIAKLSSYLENADKAAVKSIDGLRIEKSQGAGANALPVYTVTFTNCLVSYVSDTTGYFSDVSFDGVISLPDITIDFLNNGTNGLTTFTDYALIGNTGISVSSGKNLTVDNSSVYAGGGNGFVLENSANAFMNRASVNTYNFISNAAVTVQGGKLEVGGKTNIWCTDLITRNSSNSIVNLKIGENCNTYVKDDLQIEGDGNIADLSGDYYGYSYDGNQETNTHYSSSSIIVNGKNSTLDMSKIATLVVGGRAYIDYRNAADDVLSTDMGPYAMGESLALKGDQEAYMVPPSLMKEGNQQGTKLTNPVSKNVWETTDVKKQVYVDLNQDTFFGWKYLNQQKPYTAVVVDQEVYVYLNFKDKNSSAQYFNDIFAQADAEEPVAYKNTRSYMKSIVIANIADLVQTSIVNTENANVYTNGSLINADNGAVNTVSSNGTVDQFVKNSLDFGNRYSLLNKILYCPSFYMESGERNILQNIPSTITVNGTVVNISNVTDNVFTNFINMSYLDSVCAEKGYINKKIGENILFATTAQNLVLNDDKDFENVQGGVLIAKGNVTVKKGQFHGVIIAGGKITIESDAVIDRAISGASSVEEFILNNSDFGENVDFSELFTAWNKDMTPTGSSDEESIGGITYKKLVSIDKWRKTID